jgi:hypothetical protein
MSHCRRRAGIRPDDKFTDTGNFQPHTDTKGKCNTDEALHTKTVCKSRAYVQMNHPCSSQGTLSASRNIHRHLLSRHYLTDAFCNFTQQPCFHSREALTVQSVLFHSHFKFRHSIRRFIPSANSKPSALGDRSCGPRLQLP